MQWMPPDALKQPYVQLMVQFYFEIPSEKSNPYLDESFFQCSGPRPLH